jgi:predicted transcriptional regulator
MYSHRPGRCVNPFSARMSRTLKPAPERMPENIAIVYYLGNTAKVVEPFQLIQINSGKVTTSMVSASHHTSSASSALAGRQRLAQPLVTI